jgi:hypothetical protein
LLRHDPEGDCFVFHCPALPEPESNIAISSSSRWRSLPASI